MRFPLLVHFSPSVTTGPKVLVRPGYWKVVSNHKETELELLLDDCPQNIQEPVEAQSLCIAQVRITKAGSEKELNIYLEKV